MLCFEGLERLVLLGVPETSSLVAHAIRLDLLLGKQWGERRKKKGPEIACTLEKEFLG